MRTRDLKNPYFADGWMDWTATRASADAGIATVDSIKYGLMSGRSNGVGFPRVGQNYMLIARQIDASGDTDNNIILATSTSYPFGLGDIVTYDIGYHITQYTASAGHVYLITQVDAGAATNLNLELPLSVGVHNYTIAWRVDAAVTAALAIKLRWLRSGSGSYTCDWLSVDNVQVHQALDYLAPADANDTTGVA